MPILAVVGIGSNGEREVLGFQVGDRENQQAWEDLFEDLKRRGVKEIGLLVSDGNQSTMNAIKLKFPQACRQRCVMHKMENVLSYVPSKQRDQFRPELRAIFYQKDRASAELRQPLSWRNTSPSIRRLWLVSSVIWTPASRSMTSPKSTGRP